ncbi:MULTISPECIES: amino acid ABC transporter permease [unclassified Brenneria]|uniref:amino acid ABC transporter permease n=1 Tax=unclassified Brenneria TaxID=2634434 RepID=UPI0029C10667|nr:MULTISPECIES: amino acid ABC transporter permease [unclassified Brenneria]MDX5627473.1 amino acid ABC transporter permease [Brenneria sp. L3-3Z]MDX5694371.1 amino acid ABC transporter permease [Brenneria sp. L4-2C]MEE3662006.1 amino acid ABC transporter permease [Brenneria sp. g21c3]
MNIIETIFPPQSAFAILFPWLPLILKGFGLNLLISVFSMIIGVLAGTLLGAAQMTRMAIIRMPARLLTLFFRNSPWLVIMFYVMFLLPFEIKIAGTWLSFPDWIKAVVALAIPVSGYTSEIVRGGLKSIPTTQWEAAAALAFGPVRTTLKIILPQALRQMVPPAMNLYCSVIMATSLANVVGVQEIMTVTQTILTTETRPGLILPAYGITLVLFFAFVFPISLFSRRLERTWQFGTR